MGLARAPRAQGLHVSEYGSVNNVQASASLHDRRSRSMSCSAFPVDPRHQAGQPQGGTTSLPTRRCRSRAPRGRQWRSRRGLEYLAITDHSATARVRQPRDADALRDQDAKVRALNASLSGVELLIGARERTSSDGWLDTTTTCSTKLDWVVGSSSTRPFGCAAQDNSGAHRHRLREHPWIDAIGGLTGRKIETAPPYQSTPTRSSRRPRGRNDAGDQLGTRSARPRRHQRRRQAGGSTDCHRLRAHGSTGSGSGAGEARGLERATCQHAALEDRFARLRKRAASAKQQIVGHGAVDGEARARKGASTSPARAREVHEHHPAQCGCSSEMSRVTSRSSIACTDPQCRDTDT